MANHQGKDKAVKEPETITQTITEAAQEMPSAGTLPATQHPVPTVVEDDETMDFGGGLENVRPEEQRIPFLRILDPKSPQCAPREAGGLGAAPGSFFNVASKEIYDPKVGLIGVPAARDYNYVKYLKRNKDGSGGGFESIFSADDPLIAKLLKEQGKFKKLQFEEATGENGALQNKELVETMYIFGVFAPANNLADYFWACIGYSSTQIKHYQTWFDRTKRMRYPDQAGVPHTASLWVHPWLFKTQFEKKGGNSWYGWDMSLAIKKEDGTSDYRENRIGKGSPFWPMRLEAKTLHDAFTKGHAKADTAQMEAEATAAAAAEDEEIPY